MNRAERRAFRKKLGKQLGPIADDIIELHKKYEGKDDEKLERLLTEKIKELDYQQLMLVTAYIESSIGSSNS